MPALNVIPPGLFDEKGILQDIKVALYGVLCDGAAPLAPQGIRKPSWICEAAGAPGNNIDQLLKSAFFPYAVPLPDIPEKGSGKILKELFLFTCVFLQHRLRKPAISHVFTEQLIPAAVSDRAELAEGERCNPDLVASSPEFGNDVPRQAAGTASGNVYISIGLSRVAVEDILKLRDQLDPVKENVVHAPGFHMAVDIAEKRVRIAEGTVSRGLKIHADNVIPADSGAKQIFPEKSPEKK